MKNTGMQKSFLWLIAVLTHAVLSLGISSSGFAMPPDDYLGDAAIYTGVPSDRPSPNVLLVIDTSRATLSAAAGAAYNPATTYISPYNFVSNYIYIPGQDGKFDGGSQIVKSGSTPLILGTGVSPGVTCTSTYEVPGTDPVQTLTVDTHDILATYGTYSGAGTSKFPNLAGNGACTTAPQGQVYATGNYLNYINSTAVTTTGQMIIQHLVPITKGKVTTWENRKFRLIKNIEVATARMEPGIGADRAIYWSMLSTTGVDATTPVTHEYDPVTNTIRAVLNPAAPLDGWHAGSRYYSAALDPTLINLKTQRQVFYEALVPVINGASTSVNFGFLKYNRMNQGAVLGAHIREYGADPSALIAALPSMATCSKDASGNWLDCPDLIASGPNRPASEALFDAGWYLRTNYPTEIDKVSPLMTEQVPISIDNPCGYNHIIYITNGLPNQDTSPKVGALGDRDKDNVGTEADEDSYGLGSHYLDDVAYYLNKEADLNGDGKIGDVTTHVILAFQNEDELMRNTALDGGGNFYNVFDTNGLTRALLDILANIVKESDTAFVAPVVPASSTNRTQSSNRVYLGLFKPQSNKPWHGNLKKYRLSKKNELVDIRNNLATLTNGDFTYSQSYWGTDSPASPTRILSADGPRNLVPEGFNPGTGTVDANGGDGGIVDAGGVGGSLLSMDISQRKIFTYVSNVKTFLRTVSAGVVSYGLAPDQVGYLATETLKRSQLIDYIYGYNAYGVTYSTEGQNLAKRNWILGDILHSKPLVRSYNRYRDAEENVCYNPASPSTPHNGTVIYVGANDGMLHAVRDCDGSELWAFIPPVLLPDLKNLSDGSHEYYVDGSPVSYVYDADQDGNIESGDKVILVFGLRRGGGNAYLSAAPARGAYYALDVTDPANPVLLWERTSNSADFSELGESWGQPTFGFIKDGTTAKLAMFVGAGYDNNEDRRWGNTQEFPPSFYSDDSDPTNDTDTTIATNDGDRGVGGRGVTSSSGGSQLNPKGRGVYVVEMARVSTETVDGETTFSFSTANSGTRIWSYTHADDATNMKYSFPTDLAVIDWDSDGFVDRIYAGDTGGQVWRFNLTDTDGAPGNDSTQWAGNVIFRANPGFTGSFGASGSYTTSTDGSTGRKFFYRPDVGRLGGDALVFIGSGDREHPLNLAVDDRLYMIRDKGQITSSSKTEANLLDLTDNQLQSGSPAVVSGILNALDNVNNYGWYIRLEGGSEGDAMGNGEKMLAPPVLFFGQVFFTTYAPITTVLDQCEVGNLGYSRLYHLNYATGEAFFNYDTSNDTAYNSLDEGSRAKGSISGEVLLKSDRIRTLGEGIPSGIVTLIDASGKVTLMISASNRVSSFRTVGTQTTFPIYWIETK